jgi:C4-dicarboxylate transporter DctM subunit
MTSPSRGFFRSIASVYEGILRYLDGVGSFLVLLIMILVCSDITARSVFNSPLPGVPIVVSLCITVVVFLQLGPSVRSLRMVSSDQLLNYIKKKTPELGDKIERFFFLLCSLIFLVMAKAVWSPMRDAITENEFVGVVGTFTAPTWPMYVVVFCGCILTGLQYLIHTCSSRKPASSED